MPPALELHAAGRTEPGRGQNARLVHFHRIRHQRLWPSLALSSILARESLFCARAAPRSPLGSRFYPSRRFRVEITSYATSCQETPRGRISPAPEGKSSGVGQSRENLAFITYRPPPLVGSAENRPPRHFPRFAYTPMAAEFSPLPFEPPESCCSRRSRCVRAPGLLPWH